MLLQQPYKVYKAYLATKAHFYSTFNLLNSLHKNTRTSEEAFNKRKDKHFFAKIASKISYSENIHFFISQMAYRDLPTPSQIVVNWDMSKKIYDRWLKNISFIFENFDDDIKTIAIAANYNWKNCFIFNKGDYPLLFKLVTGQKIHVETYSLLDDLFQHTIKENEYLKDDMIFKNLNFKYQKYRILLKVTTKEIIEHTPTDLSIFKEN